MDQTNTEKILQTIDHLFDENKPKEAEQFMLSQLKRAEEKKRPDDQLMLLNELIGYYRQTSEKEPLQHIITKALQLADDMDLNGTIPYATTLINAANAYRSMGLLKESANCYQDAESIYDKQIQSGSMQQDDMLLAGLYNNISLLYQELGIYKKAEEYLLKALAIVEKNNAGFEIAVTHANLANTYLGQKNFDTSIRHAKKAISLFEARNLKDPHHCAALSALGSCYLHQGKPDMAMDLFKTALQLVEETFGKNSQYQRLMENINLCEKIIASDATQTKPMTGMELSKAFYEKYGKAMIAEKFPEYENKIAVGLVGEGSECYGFDDATSTDHDFGPDFVLWITDETYDQIGEQLIAAYSALPQSFLGYDRKKTTMGEGRRGVFKISDFYKKHLGTSVYEEIDFLNVPEYALAVCTNGQVFRDDEGIFTAFREKLKAGFPDRIRLLKLSEDVAGFSQCGQYNYSRMKKRKDDLTASLMLADFCKHAMRLYHHFCNVYPPHDKWLKKSTSLLPEGPQIVLLLENLLKADALLNSDASLTDDGNLAATAAIESTIEQLASFYSASMYDTCDISDTDSYLDHHIAELMFKADISPLDDKTLVDRIAKLEFKAFDKVKNEGGRASCQNNWPTFSIMRKSQYLTWNRVMLIQYLYDFTREYERGHNLITEKYGRMMESTAPERYAEIKDHFPVISEEKKNVIEQIIKIQMQMVEALASDHPNVIGNARNLHTYEDDLFDTSYETYLRGEISTYSDKMLQLYGAFVVKKAKNGENIARLTMENTAKLYGYKDIDELESKL